MLEKIYKEYKDILLLGVISIFMGISIGAIDTLFGKTLIFITEYRDAKYKRFIPFLFLAGMLIVYSYNKYGKGSQRGMSLVFETAYGENEKIPIRLIPFTIISTWITHLFGGSAGREGVAVQIGATVGQNLGSKIKIKDSDKILLISGMAAGFAGLFQTPIAAIFFALEVLVAGTLEYKALITCLIAAFASSTTSHFLGLEKFTFNLNYDISFDYITIIKLSIAGIIFGIVGGFFAHLLGYLKKSLSDVFKNPIIKIAVIGIIISIFLYVLHSGRYCGLGTNLISDSFLGNKVYTYDWILKFIFTIITLSAGFQGGEVTPLFSIGASLGVVLAGILNLPIGLVAALGYAAVFGSATNTYLAPIFIGAEVFGYNNIPLFFITCTIAYVFNGSKSIYSSQKRIKVLI